MAPPLCAAPVLGLAYQPYVGQWSAAGDNPYAPGQRYTPSFNTYAGGIDLGEAAQTLLFARQEIDLVLDSQGRLKDVSARGKLDFRPEALSGADPERWSRTYYRWFEDRTARPARKFAHQASVYRQLRYLVSATGGAPLTLATYGPGFEASYWRELEGKGYAALPVWTLNQVRFIRPEAGPSAQDLNIDQVLFYFPPTSAYVRAAPERILIETEGEPGQDLKLLATHQRIFAPARKGERGARLNPGFFAGDANGQVALAAAEINAQAGKRLVTIKLGVGNLQVAGSLVNDRMRFGILSALGQASVANARYPGTVTHLILSNEFARPVAGIGDRLTPTQQVTEMARHARAQMAAGGDFEGLGLKIGVRGNAFLGVQPGSTDPDLRKFTADVAELIQAVDFLMENRYPSQEAVESARETGNWGLYFDPDEGELTRQWRQLTQSIGSLPGGERIELMIGEIGHPTRGLAFNLPGYVEDGRPAAGSAFAKVTDALTADTTRIEPDGLRVLSTYFNDALATDFLERAFAWSRRHGVQIHAFEAFDEPHKSVQNLPLPGRDASRSILDKSGPYGAEAAYGLFGYSGVAAFQALSDAPQTLHPGSRLTDKLPAGIHWSGQFDGHLYPKLPNLDLAAIARAFEAVTSP